MGLIPLSVPRAAVGEGEEPENYLFSCPLDKYLIVCYVFICKNKRETKLCEEGFMDHDEHGTAERRFERLKTGATARRR